MESENYWKGWDSFLKGKAVDFRLTPTEINVFINSFSRENCHKSRNEILQVLPSQNEQTYPKTIGEVYNKFQIPGPKGKFKKLLQKLEEEYKNSEFVIQSEAIRVNLTDVINQLRDRCYELLEHQKSLTTNSLMARDGLSFPLDDLFIKLSLVKRKKTPRQQDITSAEQGSQLYTAKEEEIPYEYQQFLDEVSGDRTTAKGNGKRTVLIGERGAGKTTLLQKIGNELQINNITPIWISLRQLGSKPLAQYLLEDWLRDAAQTLDTAPPEWKTALEELLKTGQVCLLLDGVDEMTLKDRSLLQEIGNQLQKGLIEKVQVILTCRINTWEKDALEKYQVYRCLPFEKEAQIEEFIDKFFSQPETNSELGDQLKAELQLENKVRIRDLIKNPLRLCLLCYAWNVDQGKLPDTQAELYQLFVKAFYKLHEQKYPHLKVSVEQQKELEKAMGELAKAAFDNETFRFLLPEDFVTSFMGDSDDENSLFCLAKKVGWLNCVGRLAERPHEDGYAFFHATFQEYFAALAIDDWDFFVPRDHVDRPVPGKPYRIFELQWKETILFWLGSKHIHDNIQKEEFIQHLTDFNDGLEGLDSYTYTTLAYFLAATGIDEFRSSQAYKILLNVIKFAVYYESFINVYGVQKYAQQILYSFNDKKFIVSNAENLLSKVILESQKINTIINLIWLILKIDSDNSQALISSIKFLNHENSSLRRFSISLIEGTKEKIIFNNEASILLIDLLKHKKNYNFFLSFLDLNEEDINSIKSHNSFEKSLFLIIENLLLLEPEYEFTLYNKDNKDSDPFYQMYQDHIKISTDLRSNISQDKKDRPQNKIIENFKEINPDLSEEKILERWVKSLSYDFKKLDFQVQEYIHHPLMKSDFRKHLLLDHLFYCAQHMAYPEFYHAWNSPALITSSETPKSLPAGNTSTVQVLEEKIRDLGELLKELQPTHKTYPIVINAEPLEDETDHTAIAQELCNQIYQTVFPDDENIPEVNHASQLKRLIPKLKKQLNTQHIALILYQCEPNSDLISFCRKLTNDLHVAFITTQKIEPPLAGFPDQPHLVSILQNWLSEREN